MTRKRTLPVGIYRRKNRAGDLLPTLWCWYYERGHRQPTRESTGTEDVDAAVRFRHARLAETGQARAVRRDRGTVRVADVLALVVEDYADEGRAVPPGIFETLNHALGRLRAVEDVEHDTLAALCREWRRVGVRWHQPATGKAVKRPDHRVRPLSKATCNRYMAFVRRGYALARKKWNLAHPTLTFPAFKETPKPTPIPADVVAALFEAMEAADEPEARRSVLRFLYLAGPRVGQVLATDAAQFASATGTVAWRPEDTKTDSPHIVTYAGETLAILRWFAQHRDRACPALFQEDGRRLTKDRLDATWHRACVAVGLPVGRKAGGYTIHHLRHTFVSEAHDAGLSAGVIMAHTGHVQEPTMLHYLRMSAEAQQRAQAQLEAHRRAQAKRVAAERRRVLRLVRRAG